MSNSPDKSTTTPTTKSIMSDSPYPYRTAELRKTVNVSIAPPGIKMFIMAMWYDPDTAIYQSHRLYPVVSVRSELQAIYYKQVLRAAGDARSRSTDPEEDGWRYEGQEVREELIFLDGDFGLTTPDFAFGGVPGCVFCSIATGPRGEDNYAEVFTKALQELVEDAKRMVKGRQDAERYRREKEAKAKEKQT